MTPDFTPSMGVKAKQCAALLAALRQAPITTIAARDALGIASPAARVLDLRRQGFSISTVRTTAIDGAGRPHSVALYRLDQGATT